MAALREAGAYTLGGEHYKRVPRGYDAQHPAPACCATMACGRTRRRPSGRIGSPRSSCWTPVSSTAAIWPRCIAGWSRCSDNRAELDGVWTGALFSVY